MNEENITDNEFLLMDRLQKIRQIIYKYREEYFYISYSGGKDSTVLSALVDMAVPKNKIPRVYANTGIEWNMIRDFVFDMAKVDDRVEIIKPIVPIKQTLDREGYPFKSKEHSLYVDVFQRNGWTKTTQRYLYPSEERKHYRCPNILRYQFEGENTLRISDKCCKRLKEQPLDAWAKKNNKSYSILGIMQAEGGRRNRAQCLSFRGKKLKAFQPLVPLTKEWQDWFIATYNVSICDIYKSPYNFKRTGCKGCPFALNLQEELDIMQQYFPNERKQCEIIWKPVYDEYRRLGYRLRKD